MSISAFGALLLSANLASGQENQSTTPADGSRSVLSAASAILRVPDLDKTRPTFTATTITVSTRDTVFDGNVVVQLQDTRVTADRVVVSRDGEMRFEGNVQVERPARGASARLTGDGGSRIYRFSVGRAF